MSNTFWKNKRARLKTKGLPRGPGYPARVRNRPGRMAGPQIAQPFAFVLRTKGPGAKGPGTKRPGIKAHLPHRLHQPLAALPATWNSENNSEFWNFFRQKQKTARYSAHDSMQSLKFIEMHATVSLTLPRIFIASSWEYPKVRAIARIFQHLKCCFP